jgi:hypothetical protein
MAKRKLYEIFLDRMTAAIAANMPFEASWYAYAILEDRLVSMLHQSGGAVTVKGDPIRMMGPKIKKLRSRAKKDDLLKVNFPQTDVDVKKTELWKWKDARDALMHGMADGSLTINQIDIMVANVAVEGARLSRLYAAAATRLKKHREKVPPKSAK